MTEQTFSHTHCRFGVAHARCDAAGRDLRAQLGRRTHDVAEGVHRPFAATAAVFAPIGGDGPTLALVAVDLGWFQYVPDEQTPCGPRSWSARAWTMRRC